MCGIAGILKLDPRERVERDRLLRMRDLLAHRGPDGEGLLLDGPAGLGHRRLAIVDVQGGVQPMASEDGDAWIVYNGEVYNHPRLRPELESRGHVYATRSDTETVLHLYEESGERCVEALEGMFAFAIWDRARGRLLLARDRLGIKPLYYAVTDREILFASEIKSILAAGVRPEVNREVIPEYLATRFVSGPETFFRGIRKLQPGRTLVWSRDEGVRIRRYWQPPSDGPAAPAGDGRVGQVRERLLCAARSHLMSDVPLGMFLSGGLDSTALAGMVAPMLSEPLNTFAVGFSERDANELDYARIAAASIGARHHELIVSPGQFFAELPRLVWHEDEPIAFSSSVPLHFLSRLARRHVKVVLTGEGADELFLGYNRYRLADLNDRLSRVWGRVLPARSRGAISRLLGRLPLPGRVRSRLFLTLPAGPRGLCFDSFAVMPEALQRRLLADADLIARRDPYAETLRCFEESDGGILERMSHADLQTYLVELLMKQDQMSMAASLESRVPYLDHRLVETVAAIPGRVRLKGWQTKALLRSATRGFVPRTILQRRKMGFPVPLDGWFRGEYRRLVDEWVLGPRALARGLFDAAALRELVAEHDAGGRHGERLWLLVNLEIWHRIFIDGETPAAAGGLHAH